eukprot:TRINITY_DN11542_c0_g1_i3.p1 TRINITY_DN11542_c0_g1~~TRINITY_DN11542_c0_g1_i3.p1  ORF type:complete len:178 (+),score=28.15 TRINITY_DN11542_c0_g1_i3:113-646(+)
MALFLIPNSPLSIIPLKRKRNTCFSFPLLNSHFLPSNPLTIHVPRFLSLKKKNNYLRRRSQSPSLTVVAAQSNWLRVFQTALRVGRDGIEAGANMVPVSVPRPVARIAVGVVAAAVALFLFKSFLSTAFFVLAMMGFIYFVFIALNKDEGPKGGGGGTGTSDEESLEEARRIMEKYK